jgi:hypothetical protein
VNSSAKSSVCLRVNSIVTSSIVARARFEAAVDFADC